MLATQENATWLQRKCENIVLALCGKVKQTDFVVVCTCSLLSYFVAVFAKVELLTLILLKPMLACNISFINLINSNKKIFLWKFEKHARMKSNFGRNCLWCWASLHFQEEAISKSRKCCALHSKKLISGLFLVRLIEKSFFISLRRDRIVWDRQKKIDQLRFIHLTRS